jgi:ligand-binding sensor domain-containing protein
MRRCGLLTILVLLGGVDSSASETAPPDIPAYSRRVWRSADGLPEDFAQSLAQTQDGYLWIGTSGGLARFDGVSFVVFNRENTPAFLDDSVYSLLVTKDGTLWAGTEGGGLIRYKDGRFRERQIIPGRSTNARAHPTSRRPEPDVGAQRIPRQPRGAVARRRRAGDRAN